MLLIRERRRGPARGEVDSPFFCRWVHVVHEGKVKEGVSMSGEGKTVEVGWVSLSRSGKSLTVKVLGQIFFVKLGDLHQVLNGELRRASLWQWVESLEQLKVEERGGDLRGSCSMRRGKEKRREMRGSKLP